MLTVASGCSDEPPLPPIVWEGEHLRFGTDADDSTLCAGTLPYLDGVVGHLGEVFGRPDARVSDYWLPDGTDAYCPAGVEGCVGDALGSLTGVHLGGGYCLEPSRYLFRFAVEEDVENENELLVRRVFEDPCDW